jgi:hypothetical protein
MYRSQVETYEKAMEEYVKLNPEAEEISKKRKTESFEPDQL